jgi:hypothetical protein
MRESYPPVDAANSPAPELPEREPEKLQFSLRQLLAFMLVSAVLAAGLRYVLQLLPDHWVIARLYAVVLDALNFSSPRVGNATYGWLSTIITALGLGALAYFFFRAPILALQADRLHRRWIALRGHRRELENWSRQRLKQRTLKPEAPAKE